MDKFFWPFVFLFYGGVMLLAVYLKEAGIAAIFGFLVGQALETYRRVGPHGRL